jgi:hypothetical protein
MRRNGEGPHCGRQNEDGVGCIGIKGHRHAHAAYGFRSDRPLWIWADGEESRRPLPDDRSEAEL